jgi:peptidoglycan hydrolase-like protein with peptidoglycan-binding domain
MLRELPEDTISTVHTARVILAVATAAMVCGAVVPIAGAAGDHTSGHSFGEMVDYPLVFPVAEVTWFEDWFWAQRASGTHQGQDLFAPKGSSVVAAASGVIERANSSSVSATENPEGCCSLVVRHDDGWKTVYVHLDNDTPGTDDGQGWGLAESIDVGARIEAGQVIGFVGDSGNAEETSPHLHFELHDPDGVVVNPYDSLLGAVTSGACTPSEPPSVAALVGSPGLLRVGSSGRPVRQLQRLARYYGHAPGPIDGIFGPLTRTAVMGLQADLGVTVDGIVGDQTRTAVGVAVAALQHAAVLDPDRRLLQSGSRGADIAAIQVLLTLARHDPGPIDGVFGPMTRDAVIALQDQFSITPDGVVGPGTRRALAEATGILPLLGYAS